MTDVRTATRIVTREKTSVQEISTDICVVGAGIAGISAALEAARLGHKVVLIDGLPALGGQAVNSKIHMFCGLFSNAPDSFQLTHGIADEILRDLGNQGALHYRHGAWTTVMYDVEALSRWIEEAVRKEDIKVILGAVMRGVTREERRISSIELASRYGDLRVNATGFVDASGDASLTWQAGLPCREPADGPIYGSHMMILEGVEHQCQPTKDEISALIKEKGSKYGIVRASGQAFPFPPRGKVATVNLTHEETPLDTVKASEKMLEGKAQADRVFHFLKSEFSAAFGSASIRSYGLPGIRQTRWIVGRQQLSVDDVRAGTRFPDAIARTAWPLEIHDSLDGYYWEVFSGDHLHYVPYGSLTPPDVDNLIAAGRCLDGDVAAHSSVRVMGPSMAMGAAAAHGLDLAGAGSVHQIDMDELQERIKDNIVRTD